MTKIRNQGGRARAIPFNDMQGIKAGDPQTSRLLVQLYSISYCTVRPRTSYAHLMRTSANMSLAPCIKPAGTSSSAALAGCLQSWRSNSTLRYASFSHEHRSERNYNSALWVEGAFSSETRDPGPRRSLLRGAPQPHGNGPLSNLTGVSICWCNDPLVSKICTGSDSTISVGGQNLLVRCFGRMRHRQSP